MVAHIIGWLIDLPIIFKILIGVTLLAMMGCFWLSWQSSKIDLNGSEFASREYDDESNGDR